MTDFEQIVDRALTVARLGWLAHAVVVTLLLLFLLSGWWLVVIPIYLSLTYQATIYLTAQSLIRTIPQDVADDEAEVEGMAAFAEIRRRLEAGEVEPGPELYELMEKAGMNLAVVEQTSEKKIGRLGDFEIYEWVEMYDPDTKQIERFHFHDYAEKDYDTGEPIMPRIEGKISAILGGGVVYTRDLQPARGE